MAPVGKSFLERQRTEAQAKRAREEAETAAVYKDFVESFKQDRDHSVFENDNQNSTGRYSPGSQHGRGNGQGFGFGFGNARGASNNEHGGAGVPAGPSKRHFPAVAGTKRPAASFSIMSDSRKKVKEAGPSGKFGNVLSTTASTAAAFEMSDEEDVSIANTTGPSTRGAPESKEVEKAPAKPTLHLSSLPPGMSPAGVKALLPSTLVVDNIKIISPSQLSSQSQQHQTHSVPKLWSAIVTLAQDTPATDIDAVVSSLQNRYLGWGHYLSIFRHLSSMALSSMNPLLSSIKSSSNSQPFNAQPIRHGPSYMRGSRGRFAPPPSYYGGSRSPLSNYVVRVQVPSDIRELRLIHKTVENLISHGPAFEALLMTREEVQKEEIWAWLWDPSSVGGVYYRWRLYDVLTGATSCRKHSSRLPNDGFNVFRAPTKWQPKASLKFEFVTKLEEFVSDDDYDSSEEDDSDMEESRGKSKSRHHGDSDEERGVFNAAKHPGAGYLNTLKKAKLTHLLARLPTTNTRLRKGDVARVTYFAIRHAGQGAQEVADTIVSNVATPFAFTGANPEWRRNVGDKTTKPDDSGAKLVGLFVISDILSVSATSGVRQAWRYRQLFEASLRSYNIFERLGNLERELGWGRLKIEKWRRSVGSLLNIWEGWSVFPHESHEHFVRSFEKPSLDKDESARQQLGTQQTEPGTSGPFLKQVKSRWKTVDEEATASSSNEETSYEAKNVDGITITHKATAVSERIGPNPSVGDYGDFDSLDGFPMEDSDLEEMNFDPDDDEEDEENENENEAAHKNRSEEDTSTAAENPEISRPRAQKRRPRAQDMFADSESE